MQTSRSDLPLISVRIASYNHRAFVQQALESVLRENYPRKELVVVDDASSDGSDHLIQDWIERNGGRIPVHYRRHEANQGIARTLNELIGMCEGEYVVSLASDDYLLPDSLWPRYRYLLRNPGKLAVFADCHVVDGEGRRLALSGIGDFNRRMRLGALSNDRGLRRELILRWGVPGPVLMVRRELFERVGPYDPDLCPEDWDLYLRMAAADLLGFLPQAVSAYRVHGGNVSRRPEQARRQLKAMKKTLAMNLHRFRGRDRVYVHAKLVELQLALWANLLRRRSA